MARGKKTGGRQTTLTPEIQEAILAHVRNGTPQKYAAQAVGIKEACFRSWVNRGRKETSGIYFNLATALKDAYGAFIASNVKVIRNAAEGVIEETVKETKDKDGNIRTERTTKRVFEWAAAAWLLERRAQEEFSNAKAELAVIKKQLIANNETLEQLKNELREARAQGAAAEQGSQPTPLVGGDADPASV